MPHMWYCHLADYKPKTFIYWVSESNFGDSDAKIVVAHSPEEAQKLVLDFYPEAGVGFVSHLGEAHPRHDLGILMDGEKPLV